ncbi:MAG: hypothetical protein K9M97_12995, partial [Akkermansiaceae bacterium]|nr:hypothetical protein [Akkermansiaceae bacterium]
MKTPRPESNPSRRWLSRLAASTAFTVAALFDLGLSSAIAAPLESSLLFSAKIDSFAAADGESTGDWSSYMPAAQTFTVRGNPKVKTFGGVKWVKNLREGAGDGYAVLNDGTPIPCSGVTIVAAVKPIYRTDPRGEPRGEIVDIFYDRLALAISHTDGRIMVCRNYWVDWGPAISNGESTVLSLVVQTDGSYEVFANGVSVMTGGANGDFTTLTPPDAWKSWIGIGRNIWDGWSSYNGHLGDVYVYKTALGATDRETLEAELTTKFVTPPVDYTIDATATGPGGTISPAGPIAVPEGYDKTFLIAPVSGYTIASVVTGSGGDVMGSLVDINYGGAQTYPFTNVLADDSITATFAADANPATRYEAENPDNAFDNAGYPMEWHPNCSGGVCVGKWGEGAIGGFTVNVTPSESGLYDMTVADGGYGDRGTWVKVNGVDLVGNPFTPTSRNGENQGTFQCVVPLLAGANTITIYAPAGQWGPHWDYIDVADSRSGPANKITSSADAGGTISPLGDIYCAPGATIPFTITPDLYYDVASVLTSTVVGDQKVGFATQTYNMVNVTAADTIAASFIAWDPTYITGTVTVGAIPLPGVQITATGPRGPFVTTTSDPDGTYSIQVRPGETYAVTAKKSQYSLAPASQDVLAGATADLTATFVGLQPLIDLSVDTLSEGTLISWANDGTLTGQFVADGLKDTIAPTVVADYYGKKAVQF